MLRTLALVLIGVCLVSSVRYLGRLWGWPDGVSIAVVTGVAVSAMLIGHRGRWK